MELPYELREAIERQAQGASQRELKELTGELSRRYRDETGQGRRLVSRDAEALAYAVARMPAKRHGNACPDLMCTRCWTWAQAPARQAGPR